MIKNYPSKIRNAIRHGQWSKPTAGLAPGYTQANLVILPKKYAYDFLLFCLRNPKPCPLLEVTDAGSPHPRKLASNADLRTDIPKYNIYKKGKLTDKVDDISNYWSDDLVSFLIGCSFTFERALLENDIPLRHIEDESNVPIFKTSVPTETSGIFRGPLVVSMRPMRRTDAIRAVQVTSRFPSVHGAPVHIGEPGLIGIKDIEQPDFGEPVRIKEDEIPVFWACGVTPQAVVMESKPDIVITHSPGYMFVTDVKEENHSIL